MKPVLHSVSYAGLWGQDSLGLEEFINHAGELGYSGAMLMTKRPHLSSLDFDSDRLDRLVDLLNEKNLTVPCLAGYNDPHAGQGTGAVSFAPLHEMQLVTIEAWCRIANRLGAPILRLFTGLARSGDSYHAHWRRSVKFLREASEIAADHGVMIGVQNHDDVAIHYLSFIDLLDEIDRDNCKACFDAWAPAIQDGELVDPVNRLKDRIVHTTVADYVRRPRYRYHHPDEGNVYERVLDDVRAVPPGKGFIDYGSFFDALKGVGYRGSVAFEMCSPIIGGGAMSNLDRYAKQFLDFFRPWTS